MQQMIDSDAAAEKGRVFELAAGSPGIGKPRAGVPMLSYLDIGLPPLNPVVMGQWQYCVVMCYCIQLTCALHCLS